MLAAHPVQQLPDSLELRVELTRGAQADIFQAPRDFDMRIEFGG